MASVTDIGTPGAPLNTPPLTEWQAAVRDALNGSDTPIDTRIAGTPWATGSKLNQACSAGVWTTITSPTLKQTGGFSAGGTSIFVPAPGAYRVSVRALVTVAGRFIVSLDADDAGLYGATESFLFDDRAGTANSLLAGSRIVYVTSFFKVWANTATAGNVNTYFDVSRVGANNVS